MNDVPESLVERLILVSEAVVRYRIAAYRDRFDLTEIQYRLLMHVAQHSPVTLGQLARLVNRDCAQISRMVRSLVERGFLETGREPGKQAMAIALTGAGREIYRQMTHIGRDWEVAVENQMSAGEIALATGAMERLYDAARCVLDDDRPGAAARPACRTADALPF
jgi:DNA-binding MarR family transcriptional regulator